ncbi:hypothetical protein [Halomicrobium urmianum]|uniref:hypothetical protein n=1 Tax=Halomicrobium urmianum TaxID=1586233 RepID=UPI001CD9DC2A|nr:hypothetical protein [Halomicrobium urmianum]
MGGKRRRRSRSRSPESGVSRRSFLAGGLLTGVGGLLAAGSGAFTQVRADRSLRVGTASDEAALVGLDVASAVDAGESQRLVTVENNAGVELTASVSLADPSRGSVSPAESTIAPGASVAVSVDVAADAPGGKNALAFEVRATDGRSVDVRATRCVDVRSLRRSLDDRTRNGNALFSLAYRLDGFENVASDGSERFEVAVRNLGPNRDDLPERTYTRSASEDVIRIPGSGTDGGAAGDEYEFELTVYDATGDVAIRRTLRDVADGADPADNDDLGGPDDLAVESLAVTDDSDPGTDQTRFAVDYEVSNVDRFREVRVTFDNAENDWSDATVASDAAPTGTVQYPEGGGTQGGTTGQTYEIVAEAINENGIATDSRTVADVADGDSPDSRN